MLDLDDLKSIAKLDPQNALTSIQLLADQCEQAGNDVAKIQFSKEYFDIANIVVAGMGGSNYGARIVKSLYDGAQFTKIPIELVNNYWLPGYVNKKTLVILSSYSGNTEETLACAEQARQSQAQIMGITTGGLLGEFLKTNNYPGYIFEPQCNPSNQPRLGAGYMVVGLIAILAKLGKIPVGKEEVSRLVEFLRGQRVQIDEKAFSQTNKAKQLAHKLVGKIPIVVVGDFLAGAAYAVRNQFHETAKQFGLYFVVPELNHHLLEGLKFPIQNKELLIFILVDSSIYDERNRKRLQLTKEVVEKNGIATDTLALAGYSALTQTMELIQLGAWVSFYLSMLNGVDPSDIPWVDYFKQQLKGGKFYEG